MLRCGAAEEEALPYLASGPMTTFSALVDWGPKWNGNKDRIYRRSGQHMNKSLIVVPEPVNMEGKGLKEDHCHHFGK